MAERASAGTSSTLPWEEWRPLLAREPIRQGDVLRAVDHTADMWHRWLIVLTADCDLARAKHGGALSCVPVLEYSNYLSTFRLEKMCALVERKLVDRMQELCRSSSAKGDASAIISSARMQSWMQEGESDQISETLGLLDRARDQAVEYVNAFRELGASKNDGLHAFVLAMGHVKLVLAEGKSEAKVRIAVARDLADHLSALPGDAMFLNSLADDLRSGYVVYLRRVLEVNERTVVTSAHSIPFDAQYLRLGRLNPPYVYALTQQFANVFSAIGLPAAYEGARGAVADQFLSSYLELQ